MSVEEHRTRRGDVNRRCAILSRINPLEFTQTLNQAPLPRDFWGVMGRLGVATYEQLWKGYSRSTYDSVVLMTERMASPTCSASERAVCEFLIAFAVEKGTREVGEGITRDLERCVARYN